MPTASTPSAAVADVSRREPGAPESAVEPLLRLPGARNRDSRPWSGADRGRHDSVMNTRDNTATYRAIIAAVSAGDLDRLDQLIAPDLVDHNPAPG